MSAAAVFAAVLAKVEAMLPQTAGLKSLFEAHATNGQLSAEEAAKLSAIHDALPADGPQPAPEPADGPQPAEGPLPEDGAPTAA